MPSLLDSILGMGLSPTGECMAWQPDALWLNAAADGVTALALLIIPAVVFVLSRARADLANKDVVYLAAAAIALCALTHALAVVTLWLPLYIVAGWVKAVAASLSLVAALVLVSKLPELSRASSAAQQNQAQKDELASLQARVQQMSSLYQASLGREDRITELKVEVNEELNQRGLPNRYPIITGRT